jgi:hypothetical protein
VAFDHDRSRGLQEKAWLDRFLGHVRPGGVVLDIGCGMAEPIGRYVIEAGFTSGPEHGEAIGSYGGEPLYHASLGPAAYERLLLVNGFSVAAYVADDRDCGGHTVWLAQCQLSEGARS